MKVAALIPAFNEERSIQGVIATCLACPLVNEVIVISDGSSDRTAELARQGGARVLELLSNRGKDHALFTGVEATQAEGLLFIDADLIGLAPAHLSDLIQPVLSGQADTTLGIFRHGGLQTDLAQSLTPFLNGQRFFRREHWIAAIQPVLGVGYGLELVLTRYIRENRLTVHRVYLNGVSQYRKEQKLGFWRGFKRRMAMYAQILSALGAGQGPKTRMLV